MPTQKPQKGPKQVEFEARVATAMKAQAKPNRRAAVATVVKADPHLHREMLAEVSGRPVSDFPLAAKVRPTKGPAQVTFEAEVAGVMAADPRIGRHEAATRIATKSPDLHAAYPAEVNAK